MKPHSELLLDLLKDDLEHEDARLAASGVGELPEEILSLIDSLGDWEGELGVRRLARALDQLEGAAQLYDSRALLGAIGRPESLAQIPELAGLSPVALASSLDAARSALSGPLVRTLARAEELVVACAGRRFDLWKQRAPDLAPGAHDESSVGPQRAHAATKPGLDRPLIRKTQPPTDGSFEDGYTLSIVERKAAIGHQIEIGCGKPATARPKPGWGFRMLFAPDAEAQALSALGFEPEHLGALRLHYGEDLWSSLLDLLLPWRYGQKGDPIFDRAMEGPLPGRLPADPVEIRFWLTPRR